MARRKEANTVWVQAIANDNEQGVVVVDGWLLDIT